MRYIKINKIYNKRNDCLSRVIEKIGGFGSKGIDEIWIKLEVGFRLK